MDRIETLCSFLKPCKTFADVACEHGYCTLYMLENNLCSDAVISDISPKSLLKAQKLLSGYIEKGKCRYVCCDGLEKIEGTDEVLIAGIGGEEIVKILKNAYIPDAFVFQPMKNAETLRAYLLSKGCEITADDIFTDGKNYYFLIAGNRAQVGCEYSQSQLKYGKDSLKNPVFRDYLTAEIDKKKKYLKCEMTDESRSRLLSDVAFMEGVLDGDTD